MRPGAPALIAAYEAGASLRGLSGSTGIRPQRLRTYLVAHGVAVRDAHWRSREALETRCAELIAAYEAGTPLSVPADGAGVCTRTLSTFLVARGVQLPHDHGWYRRRGRADG